MEEIDRLHSDLWRAHQVAHQDDLNKIASYSQTIGESFIIRLIRHSIHFDIRFLTQLLGVELRNVYIEWAHPPQLLSNNDNNKNNNITTFNLTCTVSKKT